MTNEVPDFEKNLKSWFEANFLDGDLIQRGQMISSEECFRIACEAYLAGRKAQVKVDAEIARKQAEFAAYESIDGEDTGISIAKAIESQVIE